MGAIFTRSHRFTALFEDDNHIAVTIGTPGDDGGAIILCNWDKLTTDADNCHQLGVSYAMPRVQS